MRPIRSADADSATVLKVELAGEVLRSFGSLRFSATGWSMLPTIRPGDTLVVERTRSDQVRVGDVVLVSRQGRLCAHRVFAKTQSSPGRRWITQGDAMAVPDPAVSEDQLLGRVAYLIRRGKLMKVPADLSGADRLVARTFRRSMLAARAFVGLHQFRLRKARLELPEPDRTCPS